PTLWAVGPRSCSLLKIKKHRDHLLHVTPVARIIRLHEEKAARDQSALHKGQEFGGDQPAMNLGWVVIRLGMVTMDFRNGAQWQVRGYEAMRITNSEAYICQASLVGTPRGVTDNNGQRVHTQMVVIGSPEGAAEKVSAIATAQVDNERSDPAKELLHL